MTKIRNSTEPDQYVIDDPDVNFLEKNFGKHINQINNRRNGIKTREQIVEKAFRILCSNPKYTIYFLENSSTKSIFTLDNLHNEIANQGSEFSKEEIKESLGIISELLNGLEIRYLDDNIEVTWKLHF